MVRNMRAVLKKASWGTRRIFRGILNYPDPLVTFDMFVVTK